MLNKLLGKNKKQKDKELDELLSNFKQTVYNASKEHMAQNRTLETIERLYEEKRYKEKLFNAMYEISNRLLTADSVFDELENCVQILGKATQVDRCYIFQNNHNNTKCSQITEWCNIEHCKSMIDCEELQDFSYTEIPRWKECLLKKDIIYGKVENFPSNERIHLEPQNIISIAVIPIHTNGNWWGFIGFDSITEREWLQEEIEVLYSISNLLGTAIRSENYKQCYLYRYDSLVNRKVM